MENDGVNLQRTRPPPPQFSQFLDKKIYEKLKAICNENEIDAETFIFEVLRMALNHHKNDVEQIIENLKVKKMSNRFDIPIPHNINLFYTTKGDFVTITLDLSKSKFRLSTEEQQTIAELPLIREKCMITDKKVVLVTIRDVLLDATTLIMEILAVKTHAP